MKVIFNDNQFFFYLSQLAGGDFKLGTDSGLFQRWPILLKPFISCLVIL